MGFLAARFPCPASHFPNRPRTGGITLVELLVVLAVIGLIVGISIPGFVGYAQRTRLNSSARQVVGMLALARSMAISSHDEHALEVDAGDGEIRVVNQVSGEALEKVLRLPNSVSVTMEMGGAPLPESRVVFRPTGGLGTRSVSVTLADARDQRTIVVSGTTGAVSLQ
jgi:type IV fimbrial biogenesis protein FimT